MCLIGQNNDLNISDGARAIWLRSLSVACNYYLLFIIKIVHEVQQEILKYTKETEQYTALH